MMISKTGIFGPRSRYKLDWFESPRGSEFSMWIVTDAELFDEITGRPSIIRQATFAVDAVAGLDGEA